ncbi:hypothetical protein V4U86_28120 [Mycobacterium sp. AMU20-3851]|uniref:hypothetical protein n=1 Tax=Mycobacterium sp. AMU20-3851 TaxID=3122055 RepID=UPI0037553D82
MPDDLVGELVGPTPYSSSWLWVAGLLIGLTVLWYLAVLRWTAPGRERDQPSMIEAARLALLRRRTMRTLDGIESRLGTGDLTPAAAGAAVSSELRRFLRDATGLRAEYVQVPDLTSVSGGRLAPAAAILADLEDVQFNAETAVDLGAVGTAARELVRQWT